jgi:hypothetical protein
MNDKLILALLKMTKQYLTLDRDYGVLTHDFMGAGETTMDVLEELGYVKPWDANPTYYIFTQKAKEVLNNE